MHRSGSTTESFWTECTPNNKTHPSTGAPKRGERCGRVHLAMWLSQGCKPTYLDSVGLLFEHTDSVVAAVLLLQHHRVLGRQLGTLADSSRSTVAPSPTCKNVASVTASHRQTVLQTWLYLKLAPSMHDMACLLDAVHCLSQLT